MKILAIESSCDETAAAIIEDRTKVLSNVINTQIDLHKQYGGVVGDCFTLTYRKYKCGCRKGY